MECLKAVDASGLFKWRDKRSLRSTIVELHESGDG